MKPIRCTLGYLIRGVAYGKDQRQALTEELTEMLEYADAVTTLPIVDGIALELEIRDITPFSAESFEPYIAEHVVTPAIQARCELLEDAAELKLINKRFS